MKKVLLTLAIVSFGLLVKAQDDVGIVSIIYPADGFDLALGCNYNVTVRIQNFGGAPVSNIPINFAIGLNPTIQDTYTGTIAPGATFDFTISTQLAISNSLVGSGFAETNLVGDANGTNDKIETIYTYTGTCPTSIYDDLEATTGNITLYPNPVVDQLSIDYEGEEQVKINIYNIAGAHVRTLAPCEGTENIDISELNSGVYVIQISSESGTTFKKFVK